VSRKVAAYTPVPYLTESVFFNLTAALREDYGQFPTTRHPAALIDAQSRVPAQRLFSMCEGRGVG